MNPLTRLVRSVSLFSWGWRNRQEPGRRPRPGKPACFRPLLEVLEDRVTPAQLSVTSNLDPATLTAGTLRYAVNQANQDAANGIADTIVFASSLSGATITLTQGELEFGTTGTGVRTIDGSSLSSPLTISGNHASRVFQVDAGVTAILDNLRVIDGNGAGSYMSGSGGAICNSGTLSLNDVTVSGNSGGHGAGIENDGVLTLNDCVFSGNAGSQPGGGLRNNGVATISNSTFSGNSATWGGAIESLGTLTLSNSTLSGNTGSVSGGGLYVYSGQATVFNSTMAGNSAGEGGGVVFYMGTLALSNVTISANSASQGGGGIDAYAGSNLTLSNTIVAGNQSPYAPDLWGNVAAASTCNLIGVSIGMTGISNGDTSFNRVGTLAAPLNPMLAPLANNGGPTATMASLTGSPVRAFGGPVTTITEAASTASLTLNVAAAAAIASTPGQYLILIDGEELDVTGVNLANNTVTVTRGLNGQLAAFQAGDAVSFFTDQRGQPVAQPPDIGAYQVFVPGSTAPVPTIAALSPMAGPKTGYTKVTITGTNLAHAKAVHFGTALGWILSSTATQVVAVSPPALPGPVDVTVTTLFGTSTKLLADRYTYAAPPTILGLSQTKGQLGGGTELTISGLNLINATRVDFGTKQAGIVSTSPTQVVVTIPAGNSGAVYVRVTTAGGTSAPTTAGQFTYLAAPSVTGIAPAAGPAAGGSIVTIAGTSLANAVAVYFGTTLAPRIPSDLANKIVVVSPPGVPGTVDVTVLTAVGTSATSSADRFTYLDPPSASATSVLASLQNASIRTLAKADYNRDGILTRDDMIGIFNAVAQQDSTGLTSTQLSDLTTLVNNSGVLGMPADVANLASKVVGYNLANMHFQGQTLLPSGQLEIGATATQLNDLVAKWFLGEDLPAAVDGSGTTYPYALASGSLFGPGGPSNLDVVQGDIADSFLLSPLAEAALRSPSLIATMFTNNGDGTYTVRFFQPVGNTLVPDYVTVNLELPYNGPGWFVFANAGQPISNPNNVLWVALAEKAYAQLSEETGSANSYASLNGGAGSLAMEQIRGLAPGMVITLNPTYVIDLIPYLNIGSLITLVSSASPSNSNVIANTEYYLTGFNPSNGLFTVVSSWGANTPNLGSLYLTSSQVLTSFRGYEWTQPFTLVLNQPPIITSASSATFTAGQAGTSFTVTTQAGYPTPTYLGRTGALPAGLVFVPGLNGTATIQGTPAPYAGGVYTITIIAANSATSKTTQTFTLTVNQAPTITSAPSATFVVGKAGTTFKVTSAGFPEPKLTATGLPNGLTFTDNGNGTATISGTPQAGAEGKIPVTFTASNGIGKSATQNFTLVLDQPPTITSADSATFTAGQAGSSFTVTTQAGYPALTSLSRTGALPPGLVFVPGPNGTATIHGTPAPYAHGTYTITITAANALISKTTQTFTLTVDQAPSITSAALAAFVLGKSGTTFKVTTIGFPEPALTASTLPAGLSFTDNGNGTATISGTPQPGSQGKNTVTITASNGIGKSATQTLTLWVLTDAV